MRSLTNKWVIVNRQGEVQIGSSNAVYFDTKNGPALAALGILGIVALVVIVAAVLDL